jgi:hypothetical protein
MEQHGCCGICFSVTNLGAHADLQVQFILLSPRGANPIGTTWDKGVLLTAHCQECRTQTQQQTHVGTTCIQYQLCSTVMAINNP